MAPRSLILLVVFVLSTACASTDGLPPDVAPAPASGVAATPQAEPDSIRWVRDAAEYDAALHQVYRVATARVEAEGAKREAGSWAVVLDADETVISNLTYQAERARQGLGYSSESWNAWVKRRAAEPLPGAAAFLARVRALGGKIAIVTNRLESECDDTAAVFSTHALAYDAMLCRPDGGPSDKGPRFDAVADGRSAAAAHPLDIVAFVGDNIQDFPRLTQAAQAQGAPAFADFGVRYFVVPNPMYGSWQ